MCRLEAPPAPARRAGLELADIFRAHAGLLKALTPEQARVARAIVNCRTEALGGHVSECDRCGHLEISYNSCRNRHCPKCQGLEQARWLAARERDLIPVQYFHVVFTIPQALHPFFLADPARAYALLFAAVADTLDEVARNPRNLGARIGFTAVLHTWTQTLLFHPHIHCIVTGGGLDPTGTRFVRCAPGFFLPEKVLSLVFRGKLLEKIGRALARERLLPPDDATDPKRLLREAARTDFVVDSRRPFAGPEQVLRYLARYTHRIAISNARLVAMQGDRVTFRWKDRRDGDAKKLMTLEASEFLRRFLLHVLPTGFVRIRHYGLLANASKAEDLARCLELLGAPSSAPPAADGAAEEPSWQDLLFELTGKDASRCPACGQGRLILVETLPPRLPTAALRVNGPGP